jgi:CubicO group peptidase (beta-lactamase class C family)
MCHLVRGLALLSLTACIFAAGAVRADQVDDLIRARMKTDQIPGVAIAVVKDGKVLKAATYGVANVEWNEPVSRSTPFWLDSLTKLVTAVGVMRLADAGSLSLDDPISKYVTDAPPAWREVTIRRLLAHTSGVQDGYWEEYKRSVLVSYDPKDIYAHTLTLPLDFAPGERSAYDNTGYYLLGVVIERVTGKDYRSWITDHVLRPAGMKTAFVYDPWAVVPHVVSSYSLKDGRLAHNRADILSDRGDAVASWGIYASLDDMIAFDAALRNGSLIAKASLGRIWDEARLNSGYPSGTSLGFDTVEFVRGHRYGHKGGQAGVLYGVFPEDDLAVILLTNLEGYRPLIPDVARAYLRGMEPLSPLKPRVDPDPRRVPRIKSAMASIASGAPDPKLIEPAMFPTFTDDLRGKAQFLSQALDPSQYLLCEPPGPKDPFGVAQYCYYRIAPGGQTVDIAFGLTRDGKVAAISGTPE